MRIAYVVDVHGHFDVVERALERVGAVDVLLVGGDITTAGSPGDAEHAVERWRPLAPALLAVAGNMDSPAIDERLRELGVALDGRGVTFGDVGIAGVSGSPETPMRTPYELPDEEVGRRAAAGLAAIAGCRVQILCPHAPPHGTYCDAVRSGEHVGSRSLRAVLEREQPDLVLCGHIHEARGEDSVGRTRIVNPGPAFEGHYAIIDVGEGVSVALDESSSAGAR